MVQLFVDEIELDMKDDVVIPLTYSISDVTEPEKLKRSHTKSLVLPGTRKNNAFFQATYRLGLTDLEGDATGFDFDPSQRYDARIVEDGRPIFKGSISIDKVMVVGSQKEYYVTLFSEIATLFQKLSDINVAELGWSDYDFTLSVANIEATWTAATGSGVWYPLIDLGYSDDAVVYKTNELRAYVYIKEIVEKCCEHVGKELASNFFNQTDIKKIVWGTSGGNDNSISSAEVSTRRAHYTGDGSGSYNFSAAEYEAFTATATYVKSVVYKIADIGIVTVTQDTDGHSQFDEATGELVVYATGKYKLVVSSAIDVTYAYSKSSTGEDYEFKFITYIKKNLASTDSEIEELVATTSGSNTVNVSISKELDLTAGDIVSAEIAIVFKGHQFGVGPGSTQDVTVDFNGTIDFDFTSLDNTVVDGDTINIAQQLPEMKASDFLKDMITMFNLYVSEPADTNFIKIEPLEDYYFETDDTDDWSEELARDKPIEIKPAATIKGKEYRFKFAEDRDYYKQRYFDEAGHDYGDYTYNVPSTFKKGERLYQLNIAQSVPVQIEGTNLIIPRIFKYKPETGVSSPHKGKPRIFLNNGLQTGTWALVNSDTLVGTSYTEFPSAHHLNSLGASPTFDLNFGTPDFVFYTAAGYTNVNLVQSYHLQFIRELTGRDSKLVNAFFKLKPSDLYLNFMRRLVMIDGVVFRKNKVKDYRANNKSLTKVELVRVAEGNSRADTQTAAPQLPELPQTNNEEVDQDTTVSSGKKSYVADTSGGDIDFSIDTRSLKEGAQWDFKKVAQGNKVTITPTSGTIDGQASVEITRLYDSVRVKLIDGNLYIL